MWMYSLLLLVFSVHIYNVLGARILEKLTDDVILQPGDSYTLTCEGVEPFWTTPNVEYDKQNWTTFENNNNQSVSTLTITNMSYPFVGYYTCDDQEENKDQLYLYVNDTMHLSVKDSYKIVVVYRNSEAILPCRPTSPNVKVTLIDQGHDEDYPKNNTVKFGVVNDNSMFYFYDPKIGIRTNDTVITRLRQGWMCKFNETKTVFYWKLEVFDDLESGLQISYSPKTGFSFVVTALKQARVYFCNFQLFERTVEFALLLNLNPQGELGVPFITDASKNHTEIGGNLIVLCYIQTEFTSLSFVWTTPRGVFTLRNRPDDVVIEPPMKNGIYWVSRYTVEHATQNDSGFYTCDVMALDRQKTSEETNIVVHRQDECYVAVSEENEQTVINTNVDEPVQIILDVFAHPTSTLQWYYNSNQEIRNNGEYGTNYTDIKAMLTIENVQLKHAGIYKLVAITERESICREVAEYLITLEVTAKPRICLSELNGDCKPTEKNSQVNFLVNEMVRLNFKATGNSLPQLSCQVNTTSEEDFLIPLDNDNCSFGGADFETWACYQFNATRDGSVLCRATNDLGIDDLNIPYYVSDVSNGFDLFGFNDGAIVDGSNVTVAENEPFSFTCGVALEKSRDVKIFINDDLPDERFALKEDVNIYSKKFTLTLNYTQRTDLGQYSCRVRLDNSYEYRNITLNVEDPRPPRITLSNLNSDIVVDYPKMPKELICYVDGLPKPHIQWYKDNKMIESSDRMILQQDNQRLHFYHTEEEDEGNYQCEVASSIGSVSAQGKLRIRVKDVSLVYYFAIIGLTSLCLLVAVIYILVKRRKEMELTRKLKALGLENFEKGDPKSLNPDLGIDDQAELLPYNKKFEFPFENLKLGKQLGSGAFGVVMKAEAKGLIPGEAVSTVAVKMVKKNADQVYIKALASELKIMVHLGKHVNVVNLLGACTKNVAKMELYVIVEFCRFGNLQRFLFRHRDTYINQVDEITGKINYNIGADVLNRAYSVTSDCNSRTYSVSTQDYTENAPTLTTQLSCTGDSEEILSNNSSQPDWRLNYRGDYKGDVRPICTKDLLVWAFQLARGMEYLASRNVLHGDLAARNILLAENNVVKICDFGLAKTMYNDNNYKKKSNTPLPIKWMSIESIRDRVFSTQSDVWSFGIVMWEFFSLAKTPYPGMEPDENFYNKLLQGYRLEPLDYAPREINQIMADCWNTKPMARPSFTKLSKTIGDLLETSLRKYYIDLNDPYFKANTQNLDEGQDYLAMVGSPNFEVISTPPPHYENVQVASQSTPRIAPDGYIEMRPTNIFSPRCGPNESVFHFPQPVPNSQSDDEMESNTGYLEPITPVNSISNPLYHHVGTTAKDGTPDVSMREYKNLLNKMSIIPADNLVRNGKPCQVLVNE